MSESANKDVTSYRSSTENNSPIENNSSTENNAPVENRSSIENKSLIGYSSSLEYRSPIGIKVEKIALIYLICLFIIAVITYVLWKLSGADAAVALTRAISVWLIAFPAALALAVPLTIIVGSGIGAKNGIIFRHSRALENIGKTQILVFDKDGIVTKGEPYVTDILLADFYYRNGYSLLEGSDEELLRVAASLEQNTDNPIARAITKYADEILFDEVDEISDFKVFYGEGIEGRSGESIYRGGTLKFIEKHCRVPEEIKFRTVEISSEGKIPIFFSRDERLLGIIILADNLKKHSVAAINEFKKMGIYTVMLSYDSKEASEAIGYQAGVDEIVSELRDYEREQILKVLSDSGKVAVINGKTKAALNKSPDIIRISMNPDNTESKTAISETEPGYKENNTDFDTVSDTVSDTDFDTASDTDFDTVFDTVSDSDIILTKKTLLDVSLAIRLSRATMRKINENLLWAIFYTTISIPLGAGICYHLLGFVIHPIICVFVMLLSGLVVAVNAQRINILDIRSTERDKIIKDTVKGHIIRGKDEQDN